MYVVQEEDFGRFACIPILHGESFRQPVGEQSICAYLEKPSVRFESQTSSNIIFTLQGKGGAEETAGKTYMLQ
jgi:hypothetical protein